MSPQDPQAAALLAHVVSQIEDNVQFLASQNYITQADASAILTKLPNANSNVTPSGISGLANRVSNMALGRSAPAVSTLPKAKALWAYTGDDADDLAFAPGDIIEIVEQTNADWWTGKVHGKQGLFPSAYVEKLPPAAGLSDSSPVPESKAYRPFGAAYHGVNTPPPPGQGVNNVGLQEAPGTEAKKDKFGKYKATLAHSAVGGVGFGAGSAIGGGLVRAIF
ncbi:hypothetical protein HYPSUDRAFT_36654 [Hypholoma sublateritium FD-334 SS-4]|uniref:SH3 domain-containing protein n=1 Tax=Hypholoma sublateritium (strain FD-334 SS-4) TaxID=945553 RepID=A0A0D2PCQ2_HYPSF|nr:hypothetical protein HYPSUDRAFT_36654 [Hypholoma sublateritium FD-334 SS-4]